MRSSQLNFHFTSSEIMTKREVVILKFSIAAVITSPQWLGRFRIIAQVIIDMRALWLVKNFVISCNYTSYYAKTILHLRLNKYCWIIHSTSSLGLFNNIHWAWGEQLLNMTQSSTNQSALISIITWAIALNMYVHVCICWFQLFI